MPGRKWSREDIHDILFDPEKYPDEFKAWLPLFLGLNPNFKATITQLPTPEAIRFVAITTGAPGFTGSWVDLGGGFQNVGFWKDPWGTVHLTGAAKSGTAGTEIFALPQGYRPQARLAYFVPTNTGGGEVDVTATGSVIHISGGTAAVTLDSITFRQFT